MYRVIINSFPDYIHLLRENYLEYKHIVLTLLKLVSKILFYAFTFKKNIFLFHAVLL